MPTATPLPVDLRNWPGSDTTLYRLDPPLDQTEYVGVWIEQAQPHMPARAVGVATDEHGAPTGSSMKPIVEYTHPYEPNHAGLLWLLGGYEIGEPEPELEPELDDDEPEEAA